VYVDGVLCIVHSDRSYTTGCFGVYARGAVRFRNLRADTDAPPGADWVDRCLPRHLFPISS
jgi:hypothetical protein